MNQASLAQMPQVIFLLFAHFFVSNLWRFTFGGICSIVTFFVIVFIQAVTGKAFFFFFAF